MTKLQFIVIGKKGTSINELGSLVPPLVIGRNASLGRPYDSLRLKSHGWISPHPELFELYELEDAIRQKKVFVCRGAEWKIGGAIFKGDAYFPPNWRPGNKIPQYVAAVADNYQKGRVETRANEGNRGHGVVGRFIKSSLRGV